MNIQQKISRLQDEAATNARARWIETFYPHIWKESAKATGGTE